MTTEDIKLLEDLIWCADRYREYLVDTAEDDSLTTIGIQQLEKTNEIRRTAQLRLKALTFHGPATQEEFCKEWPNYQKKSAWRPGQRLFNYLWAVRQDLARAVSGVPDLDPFHRDDLIPNCLVWLKENW